MGRRQSVTGRASCGENIGQLGDPFPAVETSVVTLEGKIQALMRQISTVELVYILVLPKFQQLKETHPGVLLT